MNLANYSRVSMFCKEYDERSLSIGRRRRLTADWRPIGGRLASDWRLIGGRLAGAFRSIGDRLVVDWRATGG
jgi:hypothetical protein